jgi:glycosyltransferase involved in cell wall biosynthesis
MGEGFSLPHIEAAACGLPVISAHHTAMKDYLNNDNSYLVNVSRREICPSGLASACGWYSGQLFNILGDEEIESFSKNMKNVVENYDVALKKSQKLQNMVKNNYTWDITTGLAARRIRESF